MLETGPLFYRFIQITVQKGYLALLLDFFDKGKTNQV
jgi:hypothetical protein